MFDLFGWMFKRKFKVTSVKRSKNNGKPITKFVRARSMSEAAMKAEPAGRSRIVKVSPPFEIREETEGDYTTIIAYYAATDANNIGFTVIVEDRIKMNDPEDYNAQY